MDTDDRTLGNRRVRAHHLLHFSGGKPMPCHVNHIIVAAHNEEIALLIEIAAIPR